MQTGSPRTLDFHLRKAINNQMLCILLISFLFREGQQTLIYSRNVFKELSLSRRFLWKRWLPREFLFKLIKPQSVNRCETKRRSIAHDRYTHDSRGALIKWCFVLHLHMVIDTIYRGGIPTRRFTALRSCNVNNFFPSARA